MPHPSRRAPLQLDLFLEEARPTLPPGVPSWTALPDGTRATLADLLARMLVTHAGGEAGAQEDDDDRA